MRSNEKILLSFSVPGRHSRARSIRRSHRTSRSADTISDSLNSYSISDPDRYFLLKKKTVFLSLK